MTPALDDAFICDSVPAELMDSLWASGWRHFGRYFFRYSQQPSPDASSSLQTITPLRISLASFSRSKSQRRALNRNADLRTGVTSAHIDNELREMFQRHKQRFSHNVPEELETFVGPDPAHGPCECRMLRVWEGTRLVAASFFDVGKQAASSVYGFFEPEYSKRSLGIFTLLLEIQHCQELGMDWLYPGYATQESSAYDYKKQFRATEWLDWMDGTWKPLQKS